MSPADRPDPRHRILALAVQVATHPPARKHEHTFDARVPWRLVTELREALDKVGVDWREVHAALRKPDCRAPRWRGSRKRASHTRLSGVDPVTMIASARQWARGIRRDVFAVWIAARDPRTPWYAKAIAVVVAAYALSPIDLIPDFIPILGYLDDLLLLPLGILLVVRMIPDSLMAEFRQEALRLEARPISKSGMALVIGLWHLLAALLLWLFWPTGEGS